MNGNRIEQVYDFTYLGVVLYSNGSWKRTQERLAAQGRKAIYAMTSLQRKFYQTPVDKILDFEALVEPVLLWGSMVWGTHKGPAVTSVYNKYHKRVLGAKKTTPDWMWMLELGVVPLRTKIDLRMISFWASLMTPKIRSQRLARLVYNKQYHLRYDNWCIAVRDILYRNGLSIYWDTQYVPNRDSFNRLAKNTLYNRTFDDLKDRAIASSKSWLFKLIIPKAERRCHAWHLSNIDAKNVRTITRLRLRCHSLAIEVGGWLNIPMELRNCYTCGELEDEAHVVMKCVRYIDLRDNYIQRKYWIRDDSVQSLADLLNSENARELNNLAIFFRKANDVHLHYAETFKDILPFIVDD